VTAEWLDRYRHGDHAQVWQELTELGDRIRDDRQLYEVARAVVRETMSRARTNVETLADELQRRGYAFESTTRPPHEPPSDDIAVRLDELEERIGPMPLALRGWYEQVGRVDLTGTFPDRRHRKYREYRYPDPLVVDAPIEFVLAERVDWEMERGTEWDRGSFTIDLAPDWLHKANVSGGGPYAMEVPNRGIDGPLLEEPHSTTFVDYLRIAFRWGGFPGWDPSPGTRESWARPPSPPPDVISELSALMQPL
jgi:hypothetical protein